MLNHLKRFAPLAVLITILLVGWKVIAVTTLSHQGFDSVIEAYNALILADTTHFDGIVNFTAAPLGCSGCSTNTTYFQTDTLHPTQFAVTSIIAPGISSIVNSVY